MTTFDFNHTIKPASNRSGRLWNLLTILVLLSAICLVGAFLAIYINPSASFNPFPPSTLPAASFLYTATPTSLVALPPTWTPTVTPEPTLTFTPHPTATLLPTETPFSLVTPSITPSLAPPAGGYAFTVQKGSPIAIANIYHPELGCNWMGVGGQAVDMSGGPVTGIVIRLGGTLSGSSVSEYMTSLTGVAINYGRAGYEFKLADLPIASRKALWVQLLDQTSEPLSDKIFFDTYDSCEKNLIIINFKKVK